MTEPSLWSFISNASPIVKFVILLLLAASVASWTLIIQRFLTFKKLKNDAKAFENHFWSGADTTKLYHELSKNGEPVGLGNIFYSGFKEYQRMPRNSRSSQPLNNTQRAMRVATTQEISRLEKHLGFLATVGSTSPYVGLFGTVWGIISAIRALGVAEQATISMVAPDIAEALIATAFGLVAAIPAVIAYNRFTTEAERMATHYETFQEELTTLFEHQTHQTEETFA